MPLLMLLVAAVHLPGVLAGGFTDWDDTAYILTNPAMRSLAGLGQLWTSPAGEQYYPLTFTTYWLEYRLWGISPTGYLATNLALHLLGIWLVGRLALVLGLRAGPAFLVAALFALHPAQAATVFWIAERKSLLALALLILSILSWVRASPNPKPLPWLALSAFLFTAALLSKTQVIGLPIGLVLLDWLVLRRPIGRALVRAIPMLALCLAAAWVTISFEQKFIDTSVAPWAPELPERLQLAGATPWWYLARLYTPSLPSIVHPEFPIDRSSVLWWLPLAWGLTLAAALLIRSVNRRADDQVTWARLTWGLAYFALMLAPVSGLVVYGNMAITHVADYFVYLAAPGLWIAVVAAASHLASRRPQTAKPLFAAATVFLVFASVQVVRSAPIFTSGLAFWSRALEVAPESYGAHLGMGQALAKAGRYTETTAHFQRAIDLRPNWVDAYALLGNALLASGDLAAAEATYTLAREHTPGSTDIHFGLSQIYERTNRPREALALYESVVQADPANVDALLALGRLSLGFGRYSEAEQHFRALVALRPDLPLASLGHVTALRRLGRHADAVTALSAARNHHPSDAALVNMLAIILATSSDDRVRDPARALVLARRVVSLSGNSPDALDTLAAAQAASNLFDDAARTSDLAAQAHAASGHQAAAAESARRTGMYRSGQALRE
ncbi:MAG: tetratricopeptide repeat protein [Phycisphaerales bacterium]|nr:tetratricopeptide repeat protein [Phycisphaerales bacterium]